MSPAADRVIRRLDGARQKWWLFTLLTTAVMAFCLSFGLLLLFMLTDALVQFSQLALAGMFLTWLTLTIALIVLVCRRLGRSQRTLEATARRVEAEYPALGSNLINLVQLSEDTKNVDKAFCGAAVNQAAAGIGGIPLEEAATKETRRGRFVYCMQTPRDLSESFIALGVLVAIAVVCHLLIPNWGSAASRLLTPWEFVPSVGSVEIVKVTPGNTNVLLGGSLDIAAEIRNPEGKPHKATLFVTPQGEAESALPMTADKKHLHYKLALPSVLGPLKYRLEIGDSQTKIYSVDIREKPTVNEVEVTFHYPAYLGRANETFVEKQADLEAPQYTVAQMRIHPSTLIAKGHVQSRGQRFSGRVEKGGAILVVKMPLIENGTFTIHMFNDAGHTDPNPRLNRIHVLPDNAPTVELLKPGRQSSGSIGAQVPVMIRCGDDHGIGRVRLEMKVKQALPEGASPEGQQSAPADAAPADTVSADAVPATTVTQWTKFETSTTVVLHHQLELDTRKVKAGQTVLVRAVAWDKRDVGDWGLDLKPQEAASGWHTIRIVAEDAKAADALAKLDSLRQAIFKLLEQQIRARITAVQILRKKQLAEAVGLAGQARTQQVDIQKAAIALVKSVGQTDKEERLAIKRILNRLAFGDMLTAVKQCDGMVKLKAVAGFTQPVPQLNATQDRIIDILRKLLDATRRAQSEALAEMKKRPGGDLPDDTEKKLEEMRDKLEEFLKQQKKVIEATKNLAKTPVEDFTEEEEELLKRLAASQDEWAKFMKELHSDLSKLPEQDFANAAMCKELNEIQTELKMAKDALLKKTADIAVPLEQLGAEMAEEIKTNMEKWLPDTPDRERWSQEESLSDKDKEAPMAELPGELEDLIGELMEEEEDLFDEMEDVGSSQADSLDKGAGWDVTDGPISNMSAKGATGNRLPNTSEIGGRAGEGRSAKSSGEFVGDEAIGKGGRKTPSRLTPDPVVKGQVKDHSKDPTGGASGYGKESGQGGEGLEGPSRRTPGQRNMQRLAGKQAALRNKAEGIDVRFSVMNFHHTDLKKMIEMMARIERDLKAGRYQNALRQRKVMAEGLGNVKQYLEGEFEVRQDATANLPTDVQKEILGSMQDPSPAGWEEMNRQYFERLGTSGTGTPATELQAAEKKAENQQE